MFGISGGELFFIALIALIVLGPERLPKATRMAGLWMRRARAQWYSVKDELERELAAEEMKHSLQETASALRDSGEQLQKAAHAVENELHVMRSRIAAGELMGTASKSTPVPDANDANTASTLTDADQVPTIENDDKPHV